MGVAALLDVWGGSWAGPERGSEILCVLTHGMGSTPPPPSSTEQCISSVLAAGHCGLMRHQFLRMLLSMLDFLVGMIIALCHISGICPVEIGDVSEIVDGTLSKFLEVESAHPF